MFHALSCKCQVDGCEPVHHPPHRPVAYNAETFLQLDIPRRDTLIQPLESFLNDVRMGRPLNRELQDVLDANVTCLEKWCAPTRYVDDDDPCALLRSRSELGAMH